MATVTTTIILDSTDKEQFERAAERLGVSYEEFIVSAAQERVKAMRFEPSSHRDALEAILAIAHAMPPPISDLTSEDAIKDPFKGLAEREAKKLGRL